MTQFLDRQGQQRPTKSKPKPAAASNADPPPWFLPQAEHAQRLLGSGDVKRALTEFEDILSRLGEEPSYGRATVLERVGRCYLMEGTPLAAAEFFQRAMEVTEAIPASPGVRALQGNIQSCLGDAFRAARQFEHARNFYEAAVVIADSLNNKRAKAVDLDHLGSLALAEGKVEEAISRSEMALRIFVELGERAPQAIARLHLGMAYQSSERLKDAEHQYIEAVRIMETCGDHPGVAGCSSHVAAVLESSGQGAAAERWRRKALQAARESKNADEIRRQLLSLAGFLHRQACGLDEIRQLIEEALARAGNSLDTQVWATYGLLADVIDAAAAGAPDVTTRAVMEVQARDYRHIQEFGPRLLTALASLGAEPDLGRAVVLERLGRCCLAGGRPQTATLLFKEALDTIQRIAPKDSVLGLQAVVHADFGDALHALGHKAEAQQAFETALEITKRLGDLRGQAILQENLGIGALADGQVHEGLTHFRSVLHIFETLGELRPEAEARDNLAKALEQAKQWEEAERHYVEAIRIRDFVGDEEGAVQSRSRLSLLRRSHGMPASDLTHHAAGAPDEMDQSLPLLMKIGLHEETSTDCIFSTDLLIDVRRESRSHEWTDATQSLSPDAVPTLALGVRTCADEQGHPRFYMPPKEPEFEPHRDCVVMRRSALQLTVYDHADIVWRLIRSLDGARTIDGIVTSFPEKERQAAKRLLTALAANNAIDVSGRPIGRYLHSATKKGVVAAGGLGGDEILRLASDGDYRTYADAAQIVLNDEVPDLLESLHALTRTRRSRRDYCGKPITRAEFDALLHTACGVTGALPWHDREIKLRAYPSSGALYAVEIYPVIFNVAGLEPAVCHYVANQHALDVVRPAAEKSSFLSATLPIERDMVSGAAVAFCLVGRFKRHERKYGQGGYRMLVAEAGHISQNLVLAAVALGLAARPFGGVFDSLMNEHLALDESEEQFLLSVLIGHAT